MKRRYLVALALLLTACPESVDGCGIPAQLYPTNGTSHGGGQAGGRAPTRDEDEEPGSDPDSTTDAAVAAPSYPEHHDASCGDGSIDFGDVARRATVDCTVQATHGEDTCPTERFAGEGHFGACQVADEDARGLAVSRTYFPYVAGETTCLDKVASYEGCLAQGGRFVWNSCFGPHECPDVTYCPAGETFNPNSAECELVCDAHEHYDRGTRSCACDAGFEDVAGVCLPVCAAGTHRVDGGACADDCGRNETYSTADAACVCAVGYVGVSGACARDCRVDASTCSDGNACTVDACSATTGLCTNVAQACDDGNACTSDSCNATTGCTNTPVTCDDGNACTTNSCNPALGCAYQPVGCEDDDACTVDACTADGSCSHEVVTCGDREACNHTTGACEAPKFTLVQSFSSNCLPINYQEIRIPIDGSDFDAAFLSCAVLCEADPACVQIFVAWEDEPGRTGPYSCLTGHQDTRGGDKGWNAAEFQCGYPPIGRYAEWYQRND